MGNKLHKPTTPNKMSEVWNDSYVEQNINFNISKKLLINYKVIIMKEQSSKEWTLVLFRKFEDTYFESIDTAKFKFGRTQEEVLENEGEVMSECLISIIKSKNLHLKIKMK